MTASPSSPARTGALMTLGSMCFAQLGLGLSVGLFDQAGAQGTVWLRLAWAGVLLLALVRPRPSWFTRSGLAACVLLGVVTAAMMTLFVAAVERLPLGTASALEFLGPLTVAVARGRRGGALWPVLAAAGVLLLTEPWHAGADPAGVAFALGAAACWAAYILLTQRVGDEASGIRALAVTLPVAALVTTPFAGPSTAGRLSWQLLLAGLGLAVLLPVLPLVLELLSLRLLTTAAFGTLMALEPAIAVLVGLVLLHEVPGAGAVTGIVLVVAAGVGAERGGARAGVPAPAVEGGPVHPAERREAVR
ncbi:DMT family transporter [Kitasatospora sp. NPDC057015]|uniref:EamA family transporter n=1 Tax=Kitasatospora sp. NPDC057015 TaxID=3346001 RepID=UPI00362584B4